MTGDATTFEEDVAARAFLSYARPDDAREQGRITRLAQLLAEEFETLTGSTLRVFTDRADIQWGQDFRGRLDEALEETTFFIPILTATYFKRDECRKEMQTFVSSAQRLGLDRLLLSIRYTPVPDLREDSADTLKATAAQMQYEVWEDLRLVEETSAEHRLAIHRLAKRIVELTSALEDGSPTVASSAGLLRAEPTTPQPISERLDAQLHRTRDDIRLSEGEDNSPGLIDLMADVGPAFADWNASITDVGNATAAFGKKFDEATSNLPAANSASDSLARRIVAFRELARNVEPELAEIERQSQKYAAGVLRLDPAIRAMAEYAHAENADTSETYEAIKALAASSTEAMRQLTTAADVAGENAKQSRDLRPVLRRFETAARNMIDASRTISEWERVLAPR